MLKIVVIFQVQYTPSPVCMCVSGVCLTIPEGALEVGVEEDILVAVCRDERDAPHLTGQSPHLVILRLNRREYANTRTQIYSHQRQKLWLQ